jgi:hypothetical protein
MYVYKYMHVIAMNITRGMERDRKYVAHKCL